MKVAVDASNLLDGGGRTHLIEVLRAIDPSRDGQVEMHVWGLTSTLAQLPTRPWLHPHSIDDVGFGQFARWWWRRTRFPAEVERIGAEVLFAPGGLVAPVKCACVTMSRNMLPFEPAERGRYGYSQVGLRLRLLHLLQRRAFREADGVIFLSDYARRVVLADTGPLRARVAVIPHGVAPRFGQRTRLDTRRDERRSFTWLYVSIVDLYKHQDQVASAVIDLAEAGHAMTLDLVGRAYPPALRTLQAVLDARDPDGRVVRYLGEVPYDELHRRYDAADGFVFASTCENLPNILREALAGGMPCAVSDAGVMPEVGGDAALYFTATDPHDIARVLRQLASDDELRADLTKRALARARDWSWERCAADTMAFLRQCAKATSTS